MIINDLQWKIGGEAGFGIMTTGLVFSGICARGGLKTFAYPEYPSLIRGGNNTYQIYINEEAATSQIKDVHLMVALNKETFDLHGRELVDGGALIYDPTDFEEEPALEGKNLILVPIEMTKIVEEMKVDKVARNMVGIGASFALLDFPFQHVEAAIQDWFGEKKPELADENIALAKHGYDNIAKKNKDFEYQLETREQDRPQMVISANAAIAMGAIKAGMKFYAAYPMTPSSGILSFLAKQENKYNLVVKQTEDELAAMNMIVGAGFTGVRSMTATSGGGFALMTEAFGMAGMAEVPCVVVMGQRPGPSTGLPTWGSQGDLRFMFYASQGEFPRVILTPGDPKECFYATFEAFNIAEKYQIPVIILVDKYNQASWQSVQVFDTDDLKIERGKLLNQEELDKIVKQSGEYLRYKYTEDGISPRCVPGMAGGKHVGSSYEHNETGHTTEDEEETTKQYDKRFRKMELYLKHDVKAPKFYGPENADVTIIGWGSTKLPALAAVRLAEKQGLSINYLHFLYTYPLPVEQVTQALGKTKKTLFVEGNKLGQMEAQLREDTGIVMNAHFRKYGGRPFYPEEILEKAKELL